MNQVWQFTGEYHRLRNTAAEKAGSIHDDEPARKLGFKGAFVPGSVVGACAMPAIMDRFGEAWLQGGWFDFNFVSPVYTADRVRILASETDTGVDCRVETDGGRLCCAGRSGLGFVVPWTSTESPDDVFPEAKVGQRFESREVTITPEDVEPLLAAAGDRADCWREFVHPEHLMPIALQTVDFRQVPTRGVRQPGMWAQHAVAVAGPMHFGTWQISEHLAEKGVSGRTWFMTFEFRLSDGAGREMAVGRHKCKFLTGDA